MANKKFSENILFFKEKFCQKEISFKKLFLSEKKFIKFSLKIKFFGKKNLDFDFGLCLGFDKQCSKCLLFYYHCLANSAQNAYCFVINVWQAMLKTPIVLLSLFGKQCTKHLLFYYHCVLNNAQNAYCSIIIVCQTMLKTPIVLLSLFVKQCSKCLLFYYHCLPNNAQNTYCSIIIVC